jgi:hypothetical protein
MAVRIQMRRDTASNWTNNNPILAEGEMGLEIDTNRWKIGNGTNIWSALPYSNSIFSGPSAVSDSSDGNALRITQTGSGNALLVEDSANPDSSPFVINADGYVGIGTASPIALFDVRGNSRFTGQITSTVSTGSAPFVVASTTAVTNLNADYLDGQHGSYYAPIFSPTLTGTPLAPTASVDTNTTQIATTAFVRNQASSTNPSALGSVAIGTSARYAREDHVHPTTGLGLTSGTLAQFASTTSAQLAGVISDETGSGSLVFASGPSLTGVPTAPTAAVDTSTTQIATTAYVINQGYLKSSSASTTYATKASPTFTGTVTVPTPINSTDAATKGYVDTVTIISASVSYVLSLTDIGDVIEMNCASDSTITIPLDSTTNFPIGSSIDVVNIGTTKITIVGDSGVTVQAKSNLTSLSSQFSAASIYKRAANTWILLGDLSS